MILRKEALLDLVDDVKRRGRRREEIEHAYSHGGWENMSWCAREKKVGKRIGKIRILK